jgi:hypothetical protein
MMKRLWRTGPVVLMALDLVGVVAVWIWMATS